MSADGLPLIGRTRRYSNVVIAGGHGMLRADPGPGDRPRRGRADRRWRLVGRSGGFRSGSLIAPPPVGGPLDPQRSLTTKPVGYGSVGSTAVVLVPKIQPRPEMLGTTAGRSPTVVVAVIETRNSLSMSELATNVDPTDAWPRAAMQASTRRGPRPAWRTIDATAQHGRPRRASAGRIVVADHHDVGQEVDLGDLRVAARGPAAGPPPSPARLVPPRHLRARSRVSCTPSSAPATST